VANVILVDQAWAQSTKANGDWANMMAKANLHGRINSQYEGYWKNCKEHGKGVFKGSDGTVYEGEWQNGMFNGIGKLVNADGKVFEGQFKDCKF
jgi:hypothetical protein